MAANDLARARVAGQLDRQSKLVLVLHYVEHLSPAEIGLVVDCDPAQVDDILSTCRDVARRVVAADVTLAA